MSSPEPESILKAGVGPAKRVGNMRIKGHKRETSKEAVHIKGSESDEGVEDLMMGPPKPNAVVSGGLTKSDAADVFPPEAIQSYHDKPRAQTEFRTQHRSNIIQQPKKF
jgi:hypothetical protein